MAAVVGVTRKSYRSNRVSKAGRIAEIGPVHEVIHQPAHPYTSGLMAAIPDITMDRDRLNQIDGTMPLDEVENLLDLKNMRGDEDFHTLAGFVIDKLKRVPAAGD